MQFTCEPLVKAAQIKPGAVFNLKHTWKQYLPNYSIVLSTQPPSHLYLRFRDLFSNITNIKM